MAARPTSLTQNSDTTAPSGREVYHLQFSFWVASLDTFGYTLVQINAATAKQKQHKQTDKTTDKYFFKML
jgi:hypothetical protein